MEITNEQIEIEIKILSKQSTAPDKETPDWMESDIRRGIKRGLELAGFTKTPTGWIVNKKYLLV